LGQTQVALAPPLAPPGGLPQGTLNDYLHSDAFTKKLRASDQPLNEIAQWQLTQQPITAPREDPGRDAMHAAFAAQGETPPTTAGQAVLAAGAGSAFGTRSGQFLPGATMNLPQLDPNKLPPRNRFNYTSTPSAWGYG
jgi:hypothetical protein